MEDTELCFPHLNSSCRKLKRSHADTVLIIIILTSISVLTATLNLLVIISISHFNQLHTPTNLLLLSLAVSDFFIGLNMSFQIMLVDGCWYLGDLMCVLFCFWGYIITAASVGTMVLISVDRYVAICHPLQYSIKVTPKRVQICVSLSWFCSVVFVCLLLKDNLNQPGRFNSCSGECVIQMTFILQVADFFLTFILPITLIIVLYVRVFVVAVSQVRAMRSHIAAVIHQRSGKVMANKSELKAARTLGIVVFVFLLCLVPYYCVTLPGKEVLVNASSATFLLCLFYLNFCLNPIIYAFFYPWFRKSVKLIVTLQIMKSGSRDANML